MATAPDDLEDAEDTEEIDALLGTEDDAEDGSRGDLPPIRPRSGRGGAPPNRPPGGRPRRSGGDRRPARQPLWTAPARILREVRDEIRQVAWPTRSELVNYTAVVLTTLVIMISLIFLLNYAFGKLVLFLFQK